MVLHRTFSDNWLLYNFVEWFPDRIIKSYRTIWKFGAGGNHVLATNPLSYFIFCQRFEHLATSSSFRFVHHHFSQIFIESKAANCLSPPISRQFAITQSRDSQFLFLSPPLPCFPSLFLFSFFSFNSAISFLVTRPRANRSIEQVPPDRSVHSFVFLSSSLSTAILNFIRIICLLLLFKLATFHTHAFTNTFPLSLFFSSPSNHRHLFIFIHHRSPFHFIDTIIYNHTFCTSLWFFLSAHALSLPANFWSKNESIWF